MTPEVERKRREIFEAAYPFSGLYVFTADGRYVSQQLNPSPGEVESLMLINEAWLYWNKALDAVEIELPSKINNAPPYACYEGGWNDMHEEAVDAINATGLGLRIK